MVKAAFNKKALFASKLELNLRKKLLQCHNWSTALYSAEKWTLRKVDRKYLESFEVWCWRKMEKISRTDHVRSGEVTIQFTNKCTNINYFYSFISIDVFPYTCFGP